MLAEAPVLCLYDNVIFLVGASWIPWGLRAIDRMLRLRRAGGCPGLAAVLALQVLGGDPESAYLTAGCGVGYAIILGRYARDRSTRLFTWPRVVGAVSTWFALTLGLACTRIALTRSSAAQVFVMAAWIAIAIRNGMALV